jgi:hypothetical protein
MIIPFLFTVGLCALTHTAAAQQDLLAEDILPQEEKVHIVHLSNGVKTYIQENEVFPQWGSFRVVLRKPSSEEVRYSFEGRLDSLEEVEQFFVYCKETALKGSSARALSLESRAFFRSDLPWFHMEYPEEIAIVAVGDFAAQDMQHLIEKHFNTITLGKSNASSDCSSSIQIGYHENLSNVALRLSYPNTRKSIDTYQDLKDCWKFLLLQELFQQRLEHCSRSLGETWVHPHPRFFYPVKGYLLVSEGSPETLLFLLLWQVEAVRNDGFFEDEFYTAKRKLVNQLQYLSFNATQPDNAFLASYYADQFSLGDRCLCYQSFLEASADLVQEIQPEDISSCLATFFLDQNQQIQLAYPMEEQIKSLTQERIESLISQVGSLASFYRGSQVLEDSVWSLDAKGTDLQPLEKKELEEESVDFIQSVNHEERAPFRLAGNAIPIQKIDDLGANDPFYQLPLSEREKRFIKIIISTMADKNIIQLALERHAMESKGKKINHVHPLRFIGYILSNAHLKDDLRTIKKSSFKWDAFIHGFSKRMKEELSKGNVSPYVPGFAHEIGSTPDHVNRYIAKRDFEGLVKSML